MTAPTLDKPTLDLLVAAAGFATLIVFLVRSKTSTPKTTTTPTPSPLASRPSSLVLGQAAPLSPEDALVEQLSVHAPALLSRAHAIAAMREAQRSIASDIGSKAQAALHQTFRAPFLAAADAAMPAAAK